MMILLKAWSFYLRIAAKFPIVQTILPFIPLVIAWALVTEYEVFPRAFLPGPIDVINAFGELFEHACFGFGAVFID
jgi:NitT/TauT family transport system permease protein/taurine transport system permease protein